VSTDGQGRDERAGPAPPGGSDRKPAAGGSAEAGTTDGKAELRGAGGDLTPPPTRGDKRRYFVLMTICIGLFVISWAVVDRYSVTAAIILSAVALVIPPFAVIIANVASATDRRRP
jgi:Protein of unknown function (DUF3099)